MKNCRDRINVLEAEMKVVDNRLNHTNDNDLIDLLIAQRSVIEKNIAHAVEEMAFTIKKAKQEDAEYKEQYEKNRIKNWLKQA